MNVSLDNFQSRAVRRAGHLVNAADHPSYNPNVREAWEKRRLRRLIFDIGVTALRFLPVDSYSPYFHRVVEARGPKKVVDMGGETIIFGIDDEHLAKVTVTKPEEAEAQLARLNQDIEICKKFYGSQVCETAARLEESEYGLLKGNLLVQIQERVEGEDLFSVLEDERLRKNGQLEAFIGATYALMDQTDRIPDFIGPRNVLVEETEEGPHIKLVDVSLVRIGSLQEDGARSAGFRAIQDTENEHTQWQRLQELLSAIE